MALYVIEPEERTLHGHFSKDLPPVLSVEPGDTVRYRTLDAGWGLEPFGEDGNERRLFEPRQPGLDDGHALCGPIGVRGAAPGMALEVHVGALVPGLWGWNWSRSRIDWLNRRLGVAEGEARLMNWTLDPEAMIGRNQHGHSVALSPFMGVMGGPPPEEGKHPTAPPRVWGGNIDCKELTSGTTLYLPVGVPGARFSVGDGHAAQGDGEVSGTAIECPVERLELTFGLREDMALRTPRAKTPSAWLSFGFHEDLSEATALALADMLSLMEGLLDVDRKDALALASVVVDLRVTQIVNGVCGVHAALPHGAVR
ncbi:MAG: acetamidase/formamidase family protein [Deinococcota bacterium]|jgi:acetamidase/formamidase|nr:acetamidase/formamidase family protein [Deinococcota bacterium]